MTRSGLFLALIVALPSCVVGAEKMYANAAAVPRTGVDDARFRSFDELLSSFLAEHDIPGASVAVGSNGRVVYARGFGLADVATERKVQPTNLFRIASVSKPLTAVAVLRLVEQGKLKLDAPALAQLGGPVPADERLAKVTVRQLLQHTGGFDRGASYDPMFRSVKIADELETRPPATAADVVRFMRSQPLDYDPGTKYVYSNFGYCLLGRLVEQASGESYDRYVKDEVLKPLGIRDMHIGGTLLAGRRRNEVRYFTDDDRTGPSVFAANVGKPVPAPYGAWHLEAMDAHGAWIASAPDLVRFGMAFNDPSTCKILNEASITTMFAPPPAPVARDDSGRLEASYYGCGWSVRPVGERRNTWHTGSLPGTSSLLVRRHDGLVWAVLFNTRDTPGDQQPASLIDPLMHRAADAVRSWPKAR